MHDHSKMCVCVCVTCMWFFLFSRFFDSSTFAGSFLCVSVYWRVCITFRELTLKVFRLCQRKISRLLFFVLAQTHRSQPAQNPRDRKSKRLERNEHFAYIYVYVCLYIHMCLCICTLESKSGSALVREYVEALREIEKERERERLRFPRLSVLVFFSFASLCVHVSPHVSQCIRTCARVMLIFFYFNDFARVLFACINVGGSG